MSIPGGNFRRSLTPPKPDRLPLFGMQAEEKVQSDAPIWLEVEERRAHYEAAEYAKSVAEQRGSVPDFPAEITAGIGELSFTGAELAELMRLDDEVARRASAVLIRLAGRNLEHSS